MVNILLYSNDLVDVASFLELINLSTSQDIIEKGKGETSATFRLVIKKSKLKLKQDFEYNLMGNIEKIVSENEQLKKENEALREELESYVPKQDLSVNWMLKTAIGILRKDSLTFKEIAEKLNQEGYKNSRGNNLDTMQVSRLYKKYVEENKDNQSNS